MIEDQIARLKRVGSTPASPTADFDLNPDLPFGAGRKLRDAGVLVPFIAGPNGLDVILTKRSSALKHHPGQIAFPGGKVDPEDRDPTHAALREAREEIGLPTDLVDLLGMLPPHETGTGFSMFPILGRVTSEFMAVPEPGEVDEVFRVPLSHLADPANYIIQSRHFLGHVRRYYTVPYGPYYIWGATARILRALAARLDDA